MSAIRGTGYGSVHTWSADITDLFRNDWGTRYFCKTCGACFVHMYNQIPDIFEAMRFESVSETCVPRGGTETP